MDPETVFEPRGEYVARDVGGETILVPVRRGVAELDSVFTLNEVGSVIWKALVRGLCLREIAEEVFATFDVSLETAQRDVEEFLGMLREREVVRVAGESGE